MLHGGKAFPFPCAYQITRLIRKCDRHLSTSGELMPRLRMVVSASCRAIYDINDQKSREWPYEVGLSNFESARSVWSSLQLQVYHPALMRLLRRQEGRNREKIGKRRSYHVLSTCTLFKQSVQLSMTSFSGLPCWTSALRRSARMARRRSTGGSGRRASPCCPLRIGPPSESESCIFFKAFEKGSPITYSCLLARNQF